MNVKEKDLVQRALGLADSVGSKVDGLQNQLDDAESTLQTALFVKAASFTAPPFDSYSVFPTKFAYGNGIYVGYNLGYFGSGDDDTRASYVKSSDQANWTRVSGAMMSSVVFFKDRFVGMYDYRSSYAQYSTNGKTWKQCTCDGGTSKRVYGTLVDAGDALYCVSKRYTADTSNPYYAWKSTDGVAFTTCDTSTWDISDDEIYSIIYSKNFNRFYMVSGYTVSGGQTRYNLRTSTDFKTWTSVSGTDGGELLEIGNKVYQNYYRNFGAGTIFTECYYTADGITWSAIDYTNLGSSENTGRVRYYFNGLYFAALTTSSSVNILYYSENGISDWVRVPYVNTYDWRESIDISPSICNNMMISMHPGDSSYIRKNYSFDGFNWFNEVLINFYDKDDNNVTHNVLKQLQSGLETSQISAYIAGVNNYAG